MISTIRSGASAPAKMAFVTHRVPRSAMVRFGDAPGEPEAGDLVAGCVIAMGKHSAIESRASRRVGLFIGDVVVGAYGNRYATDQFEGYVGPRSETLHLLSVGGVCGQVKSKNELMPEQPTVLKHAGYVLDENGKKINLRQFGISAVADPAPRPKTIVVVGASMNAGKTTTVANAVRGLTYGGYRVAAGKITGTACSKDTWLMKDAGAVGIHDFSDCGHPSTYLASLEELRSIHHALFTNLAALGAEIVLFEIADGLFQRETRALLTDAAFHREIDHVLFAGVDSLSVESGVRLLQSWDYDVAASSGLVSCSALGIQECEAATPNVPCFNAFALATGALLPRLKLPRRSGDGELSGAGMLRGEGRDSPRLKLVG